MRVERDHGHESRDFGGTTEHGTAARGTIPAIRRRCVPPSSRQRHTITCLLAPWSFPAHRLPDVGFGYAFGHRSSAPPRRMAASPKCLGVTGQKLSRGRDLSPSPPQRSCCTRSEGHRSALRGALADARLLAQLHPSDIWHAQYTEQCEGCGGREGRATGASLSVDCDA